MHAREQDRPRAGLGRHRRPATGRSAARGRLRRRDYRPLERGDLRQLFGDVDAVVASPARSYSGRAVPGGTAYATHHQSSHRRRHHRHRRRQRIRRAGGQLSDGREHHRRRRSHDHVHGRAAAQSEAKGAQPARGTLPTAPRVAPAVAVARLDWSATDASRRHVEQRSRAGA